MENIIDLALRRKESMPKRKGPASKKTNKAYSDAINYLTYIFEYGDKSSQNIILGKIAEEYIRVREGR